MNLSGAKAERAQQPKEEPPAAPLLEKFGPRPAYVLALAGLTAVGVLGSSYVSTHQRTFGIALWVMTGLYLLAFATVASLRVGFSTEGLKQRWMFNFLSVNWREVAALERTARGYALRDAKGKELLLLFLLPPAAQQRIADAAILHARLRPCKTSPLAPILEQWERKPK